MPFNLPYIEFPPLFGDIEKDVINFLLVNGKPKIAEHSRKVAETCAKIAEKFCLNAETAYVSGILHDVSGVVKPSDMLIYAEKSGWRICEAERRYNFLLHQRISAEAVKKYFVVSDENIISAVECHTTLKADASEYDMVLFTADKLSWDRDGIPPYLSEVTEKLNFSLEAAALAYIDYALAHNMIMFPHERLTEAKAYLKEKLC